MSSAAGGARPARRPLRLALSFGASVLLFAAIAWAFRTEITAWALSRATGHDVRIREAGLLSIRGGIDGVVLRGLEIAPPGEASFLHIRSLDIETTWESLRRRRLDRITVAAPRLDLAHRPDGRWNIVALLGLDRPGPTGLEVGEVVIFDGEVSIASPLRLRATGIAARIVPVPVRIEAGARVEPDVAGGGLLGVLDVRLVASEAAGGWRVETAAISTAGNGWRVDLSADVGDTLVRLDVRNLVASEAFLAALIPPSPRGPVSWRGGALEAGPAMVRVDLDGAWSAVGRARLVRPSVAVGDRVFSLARLDLDAEARGLGAAGAVEGRLAGPGLAARATAAFGDASRLSIDGRLEGPAFAALADAAGLPDVERGCLRGRVEIEGGASARGAGAFEVEEVRLALGGRTIDLAHETFAVEARRRGGGWSVEASANVEDAAHVALRGLLDADGAVRSIETFVAVVGDPGAIAALVAPEVTSRGGRVILEASGNAMRSGLGLAGVLRIPGLHLAHERWKVEAQRIVADLPFRIDLPAVPVSADARRFLRCLRGVGGTLDVGRLGYGPYHAENIRVRPAVEGDSFYLRDATFDLYGGRGRWLRDASFRADDGYYEIRFAVDGVDLERLSREDLGRAHEAFRPPRIPEGEVALRGRADGTATLVGDDRGLAMIEVEFHSAGPIVEIHRTIAAALYENFAYGALDSVLGPVRLRAEEAVRAGIERGVREGLEAAGRRFGVRTAEGLLIDTSVVRVDLGIRERIERRFLEETYIPYARASLAYETDVARPVKEVHLILDEGSDTRRDNINYDLNILIPGGQDPTRFLGTLIDNEILRFGGGAVEVEYDPAAAGTGP